MTDPAVVERAKTVLAGVTPGPWQHCTAPSEDSDETHAEYLAGTLLGEGERIHVLISESDDPKFAYIVPAITGDGPTSATNAEFIAAARELVPELIAEIEKLRGELEHLRGLQRDDRAAAQAAIAERDQLRAELSD